MKTTMNKPTKIPVPEFLPGDLVVSVSNLCAEFDIYTVEAVNYYNGRYAYKINGGYYNNEGNKYKLYKSLLNKPSDSYQKPTHLLINFLSINKKDKFI